MKRELSKGEVEAELAARSSSIERRLDALENEAVSLKDQVITFIKERPYTATAGALAAGALIGWIVGKPRKTADPFDVDEAHNLLVNKYVSALSSDVQRLMEEEGLDAAAATRRALEKGVPLIVMDGGADHTDSSGVRSLVVTALKTAVAIFIRSAVQTALQRLNLEELEDFADSTGS